MSELREAIARAIYKAHLMFDPQFCEMCEQDQQAEIDLGWEFSGAEADAALAAIEARGPTHKMIAAGWSVINDGRKWPPKVGAGPGLVECFRAMIAAAQTEDQDPA